MRHIHNASSQRSGRLVASNSRVVPRRGIGRRGDRGSWALIRTVYGRSPGVEMPRGASKTDR
jgi:hypothetical protein